MRFENFQKAGLIIYADDDNALILALAYCDGLGRGCTGRGVWFDSEKNGTVGENPVQYLGNISDIYLRIVKTGTMLNGYYSLDGENWEHLGAHSLGSSSARFNRIGLITDTSNQNTGTVKAYFDYFCIRES